MSAAISSIATLTCSGTASALVSNRSSDTSWSQRSPVSGSSWRTPNTYRKAGIRRGTATSSSTRPGTTSAIAAHQRPKLERYGALLFVVLRPARYLDAQEKVEFGELHVFLGADYVVTIRHAESPDLAKVRHRLEESRDLLRLGPEAVLYAILDQVVDEYGPVVSGLQNDIDEIEDQLFSGDPVVSRRIYDLTREVIEFQRTTRPLLDILTALEAGSDKYRVDVELRRNLRDVHDHVIRIVEQVDAFRALLQNALTVHAAVIGQKQNDEMRTLTESSLNQNEEVKRISAWAAILFAPTLVGTIYGMNFDHMPELNWKLGYPMAVFGDAGHRLCVLYRCVQEATLAVTFGRSAATPVNGSGQPRSAFSRD